MNKETGIPAFVFPFIEGVNYIVREQEGVSRSGHISFVLVIRG